MPAMVMAEFANDLKPAIDAQRRLIARWSCSTRLLRYLFVRTFTSRQQGCSRRSRQSATATRHMPIKRHLAGHAGKRRLERLAEERLGGCNPAVSAQQKVDRLAVLIDSAIQVVPLRLNLDIGLVNPPRGTNGLCELLPALLELGNVPSHPSEDGTVGHLNSTLRHHLDEVPIRQPIGDIPSHAQLNNVGIKGALAVDRVTGNRLRHIQGPSMDRASYPTRAIAPDPKSMVHLRVRRHHLMSHVMIRRHMLPSDHGEG